MDGLRKVPDNVPNQAMLADYLGKPLTQIPDPFGKYESFAAHNNALLRAFLDRFGFDYEFVSSTDYYADGTFDETLKSVLRHYQAILDVMLPTLGADRRATYSPVLPVSPKSGVVLQVPVEVVDADAGLIAFIDAGERIEQTILGGHAKLQWKVDWAMRWVALGVDYEMSGKDLIDSVVQSSKIARVLGGRPPEGFNYEMFLDEKGEKISKSKGNGLSLDEWLTYGPDESLAFYIFREPRKAKSLHLGVIPRAVDEYWQFRGNYAGQELKEKLGNPVHHIHDGKLPTGELPVTFGLLLNLVGVMGGDATKEQVWGYLANYVADATPERFPELDRLIGHALAYHRDFVAPTLKRRAPEGVEVAALAATRCRSRRTSRRGEGGGHPEYRLRDRQDRRLREFARLVQGAVRNATRLEPRAAHGQLHRALWHRQYAQADRGGAGAVERDYAGSAAVSADISAFSLSLLLCWIFGRKIPLYFNIIAAPRAVIDNERESWK